MNKIKQNLLDQIGEFRIWADEVGPTAHSAEWESDYFNWPNVYGAISDFLAAFHIEKIDQNTIQELLYITAADNEMQEIAAEIAKYPEYLLHLSKASVHSSYANAKWQLAIELGNLSVSRAEAERILYALAKDEDEYTRRRALGALAEAGSLLVNELIEPAWSSNHQYQRMMVLWSLHKISSPDLEKYLALAELDGREHLVAWAERIRRSEVD